MLLVFLIAQGVRVWAIASLGKLADKEASKEPTYAEWIGPGALTSFVERKGDRVVFVIGAPPITPS